MSFYLFRTVLVYILLFDYACHKSNIYKSEAEIRLLYCQDFRSYEEPRTKINMSNEYTNYVELDIECKSDWGEGTKAMLQKYSLFN